MKKLLIVCAAVIAFQAHAQTANSNQNSQTSSASNSYGGGSGGSSDQTQSSSAGATSAAYGGGGGSGGSGGSSTVSGLQNYVIMTSPEKSVSTVNSNQTGTVTTNLTGGTDSTQRIIQSGESKTTTNLSGGTDSTQRVIQSGESVSRVEYGGTYTIKNVPSVNGPPLTTSNDTCMGSSSGSANLPGFGIGFGTTWTDEHCKDLKTSRELWNKGMKAASLAVDCMNPRAKIALEMTGTKCPQSMTAEERQTAFGAQASAEGAAPPTAVPMASSTVQPPVFTAKLAQGNIENLGR